MWHRANEKTSKISGKCKSSEMKINSRLVNIVGVSSYFFSNSQITKPNSSRYPLYVLQIFCYFEEKLGLSSM